MTNTDTAAQPHRQIDCPGRPACTAVHTLAELSAPGPGSIAYLDDLRHRAMIVGQAPHDPRAVRDLAKIVEHLCGVLIHQKALDDGAA